MLVVLAALLAVSCSAAELKLVFAYYQVAALDRSADEALHPRGAEVFTVVGGAAAWRLGDEGPKFWEVIGKYSRGE